MKLQFDLDRFGFPLILSAFVLLAFVSSLVVPLGEAPDEVSHFGYVQFLIDQHRLPEGEGAAIGEAHQPPLYYLLAATVTAWVPDQNFKFIANPDWELGNPDTPNLLLHTRQEEFPYRGGALAWHLVRLLSIVFGAITVWTTRHLALTVFQDDRLLALLASAVVAFLPQFIFLSSVVNNDNLVIALSALALLSLLRYLQKPGVTGAAMLGLLLGLSALAKISAFALWFAVALAILLAEHKTFNRASIGRFVLVFAVASLVLSPWLVYTTLVFGDPLNFSRFLAVTPRLEPPSFADWITYLTRMYYSFWGKFGGASSLAMPWEFYALFTALFAPSLIGIYLLARDWRAGQLSPITRRALVVFGIYGVLLVIAHLRLMVTQAGMDQARQVFSALPPLGVIVAAVLLRLTNHRRAEFAFLFAGVLGLIAVANAFNLSLIYPLPSRPVAQQPASRPPLDFGGVIRVVDYQIVSTNVRAGEPIIVEFEWQALTDVREDYWLLLQVEGNEVTVNKDGVPSAGRLTTDWWKQGQAYHSRHKLIVPQDLPSGTYSLRLGLHPFGRWEWLPVRGREMVELGKIEISSASP